MTRIMRIRIVSPVVTGQLSQRTLDELSSAARPDVELSAVALDKGPASIESAYESALAVPDTVAKIVQAEKDGVDAVICNCMDDPGVEAAREMVSIPVVGPAATSMHIAAMLGHRFSLMSNFDADTPAFENHAAKAGLARQLASVRAVNIPVLELDDRTRTVGALIEQSLRAVRQDGAHVIVFGCTAMTGLAEEVKNGLRQQGIADVPIVDPAIVALKVAEALADIGLSHSRRTYPAPPEKEILGYDRNRGAASAVVTAPRQQASERRGRRIRVITPGLDKEWEPITLAQYSTGARADTDLSVVYLDRGPAAIESSYDEALAVPDIVSKAVQAERDGMDAILLDCMANPGLAAAREKVSTLVLGPACTAMHIAAMLGHKFSVITILDSRIPQFEQQALEMGLERRLASVRSVNIPVLELEDRTRTIPAMIEQAVRAVREDGAHVLIFGCTGMIGLDREVKEGLRKEGISDVPVIDPGILNLKIAEALADICLTHSKRTYPVPPGKEIVGYAVV
jgi:allantoin racemase